MSRFNSSRSHSSRLKPWQQYTESTVPPVPLPPPPKYMQKEGIILATPDDNMIGLQHYSVDELKLLLNSASKSKAFLKNIAHCPKCGEPSLKAKKGIFGISRIYAGEKHLTTCNRHKFSAKHIENKKEVIALCLACNHNINSISSSNAYVEIRSHGFDSSSNAYIEVSPDFDLSSNNYIKVGINSDLSNVRNTRCSCLFLCMTLHDKNTKDRVLIPNDVFIDADGYQNYFLRCVKCGHEQSLKKWYHS